MFDENEVVLKAAVISDVHMLYSYHTETDIADNIRKYASAVSDLHNMAGGELDIIMMCGDYCSLGCMEQAETFAQSTRAICDNIFEYKKRPALLIGMGNHDTCWKNDKYMCMTAEEWYKLFDRYELNGAFAEDSDKILGNIHIEVPKGDKKYHFLYVETESYAENIFRQETLLWLDERLTEITRENPDNYVFVGTHGPIAESGTYGTDETIEGGAVWATAKNNIHGILAKYNGVVVFTGHTHFSAELETAIMQRNYTAINVPALFTRDFYNSQYFKFLDGPYPDEQFGMGYYIEADASGNVRIKRVKFFGKSAEVDVDTRKVYNPAYGKYNDEPESISCGRVTGCCSISDEKPEVFGQDWILEHPREDDEHLKKYSDDRGKAKPPEFTNKECIKAERNADGILNINIPAAKSEKLIIHYVIGIYNDEGDLYDEYRILGNWCNVKNGVKAGKSHTDARVFEYELNDLNRVARTIGVTAVDEFGNRSEEIMIDVEG